MRLLAAAATGATAYLVLLVATGRAAALAWPRARRDPRGGRRWLQQAGVSTTPGLFWCASAVAGATVAAVVTAVTDTPVVGVVPGLSAAALPRLWASRRRSQRLREVAEAWPDGLRELTAAIAAGMSLPQAITALATGGPQPLRDAFARVPAMVRTFGTVPALELVKAELADPTSDRVLEVLILAAERGGRLLSDVLRDLAEATAADVRALEQISTDTLEQKINARAVFVLPWLVLLTLTGKPGPFRDFYQSPAGLLVVAVAGVLSLAGMAVAGRLARTPAEERVLTPAGSVP
ncbi:MAG: type II secretion system F family protein [Euzebyales bacterium]|nr:type II secretion system F family protein [Euzebyales bacterium]